MKKILLYAGALIVATTLSSFNSPKKPSNLETACNIAHTGSLSDIELFRLFNLGFQDSSSNFNYFQYAHKDTTDENDGLPLPKGTFRVSSGYGERKDPMGGSGKKFHDGIDLAAPYGTPVLAVADGKITQYGYQPEGAGRFLKIQHPDFEAMYAHLSRRNQEFRVGSSVKKGDTIGYVGRSGRATGYHLHYKVRRNGKTVKPELRL